MCHSVNFIWEAWSFQVYEHGWEDLVQCCLQTPGTGAQAMGSGTGESKILIIFSVQIVGCKTWQVARGSIQPDRPNEEPLAVPASTKAVLGQGVVS